jgi:hypothetical protein
MGGLLTKLTIIDFMSTDRFMNSSFRAPILEEAMVEVVWIKNFDSDGQ